MRRLFGGLEFATPAKFFSECAVVVSTGDLDQPEHWLGPLDLDTMLSGEFYDWLTVDNQRSRFVGLIHDNLVHAIGGVDDGSYGQGVRADG